ncbi:PQQ-binding-like beta-propeller repeat protein [Rhodopirellula sp. SWK7]|uniref:outer membrane protein assembly factor BamB family protein n=1 Tax=Rhodopirellula sp. SWK7 TaxID=595460 RepID=UPI0002BF202E|nr:PQQ-binding-like beta-propeller repeat protein [Rhodopirellula sp. SWK7]EMI40628.1 serine/threonine protein kinase related protein [Rhodopirellula sp. SWK7]
MNRVPSSHSVNSRFSRRGYPVAVAPVVLALFLTGFTAQKSVSAAGGDVLLPNDLDRIGLVQAWRRLLSVPAGAQSIVDHTIVVHSGMSKQFVEVVDKADKPSADAKSESKEKEEAEKPAERTVYARYLLEVPDVPEGEELTSVTVKTPTGTMLDRMTFGGRASFGTSGLLDRKEAERRARNDIRRLKLRGIDAEIGFREVPTIRMYTLSNDGTIESRDAESGEVVWLRRVGDRVRGYSGFGVGDKYLTVLNGSELIKMDVTNGEIYGVDQLRYVPMRGPRHCGAWAVIPSVGNRMVAYPLDNEHRDVFAEIVTGSSLAPPALAIGDEKIAWGTSEGFVYVMEATGEPETQFRLNTDGIVGGAPAAAAGNRFFFGAASGQIYGLRATRSGVVLWSRPTGDPIFDSPIVFDEKVLFRSTYGNLMCVDAVTGKDVWDRLASGVSQVLGVIGDRIYAKTLSGSLVVLDTADGRRVHQLPGSSPDVLMTNIVSDRLYLVDHLGAIQCLHRPGADMPTLRASVEVTAESEEDGEDSDKAKKPSGKPAPGGDPFGGGADPFGGGGADPFGGGGADPFGGGGADPFGGGGAVDPFAPSGDAGADPFGGF